MSGHCSPCCQGIKSQLTEKCCRPAGKIHVVPPLSVALPMFRKAVEVILTPYT